MKTLNEIIEKIRERESKGMFFDFFTEVLYAYLTFDQAKPLLDQDKILKIGEDKAKDDWQNYPLTEPQVLADMKDYMSFAWEKAKDQKGLSAVRSIQKMQAWCWLLDKNLEIDWSNDGDYGIGILTQICKLFDFPVEYQE